ncbi:hypothetical protein CONLIGDRAFT_609300 [Coniochaeta ligniaria NRRL 30616]|uniref:Cora-domain-containing protein n=1 Tax=Coniochaeta ligniaria NRRL 30616 TaxID=1408157 RepID=A0A1J7JU10_9PEZI|nr:hypothetical protein CONLIGDRAFT_609300 [Coniochaeta ligniaria NRRL 30616]
MSRAGKSPERPTATPDIHDADADDDNSPPSTVGQSDNDNDNGHVRHSVGLSSQRRSRRHADISQHRLRRRMTRAGTVHIVDNLVEQLDDRPGWRPGSEPGVDTSKPDGGHGSMVDLSAKCQITIVDFSEDNIIIHEFDNDQMIAFLKIPQPKWVKCRWINVNALSWDVIQALGQYKELHSLAIEDLMNTQNRTKADWYHNHAFLILTLQKLVRIVDPKQEARESSSESSATGILRKMTGLGRTKDNADIPEDGNESGSVYPPRPTASFGRQPSGITITEVTDKHSLRTLQSFHASPNAARTEFMEKNSALASRNLVAVAEQVSIFITWDNTVIAFFENSADDVEVPILTRLNSPSTILRQSCDASMVAQAIIDVIIDMAIPVQVAYADVIGDIELDVLTRPNIQQSKSLYIISSEISKMRSFIQPIVTVINALRDHKIVVSGSSTQTREYSPGKDDLRDPSKGVIISPLTYVYLGDVLDHCVLINENLFQISKAAENMIDLIFNTIAARQNSVLQLLTNVTIVFLPMTFLTGYFGQNFQPFPELDQGITLFWKIAIPLMVGTILIIMSPQIFDYLKTLSQRRRIVTMRRRIRDRRGKAA